jgi:cobalt transporter subunit CbtA
MFRNIVVSAFGAALIVCLAVTALQFVTTEPLILHAEEFEGAAAIADTDAIHIHDDGAAHDHDEEAWSPADGFERLLHTALANLVVGFAIALMLLGAMVLRGEVVCGRQGLLWGIAGFAAVSLLPALGLPPELPGTPAADIVERQIWWLGTAAASVAGIALLAFTRNWGTMAIGMALLVAPHVVGAPAPPSHAVPYPGALAGEFVIASIIVSACLWLLAGTSVGWLYRRLARSA